MRSAYLYGAMALNLVQFFVLVGLVCFGALSGRSEPSKQAGATMLNTGKVISHFQKQAKDLVAQQKHSRESGSMIMQSCLKTKARDRKLLAELIQSGQTCEIERQRLRDLLNDNSKPRKG